MGSLRCRNCSSLDILFTPAGMTCDECGSHEVEWPSQEVGLVLDFDGQVNELERMYALADTRSF